MWRIMGKAYLINVETCVFKNYDFAKVCLGYRVFVYISALIEMWGRQTIR